MALHLSKAGLIHQTTKLWDRLSMAGSVQIENYRSSQYTRTVWTSRSIGADSSDEMAALGRWQSQSIDHTFNVRNRTASRSSLTTDSRNTRDSPSYGTTTTSVFSSMSPWLQFFDPTLTMGLGLRCCILFTLLGTSLLPPVQAWPSLQLRWSHQQVRVLLIADGKRSGGGEDHDSTPAASTDDETSTTKKANSPYGMSTSTTATAVSVPAPAPKPTKTSSTTANRAVSSRSNSTATSNVTVTVDSNSTNATYTLDSTYNKTDEDNDTIVMDDDSASLSQWDMKNLTNDSDTLNSTAAPLLPKEKPQPTSWPIVCLGLFVALAAAFCSATAVKTCRQQRKRANYHEIQTSIVV